MTWESLKGSRRCREEHRGPCLLTGEGERGKDGSCHPHVGHKVVMGVLEADRHRDATGCRVLGHSVQEAPGLVPGQAGLGILKSTAENALKIKVSKHS